TDDKSAIMVLNRSRYNLGRRSCSAVHQHNQRIISPAIPVRCHVPALRGRPPMMRNNQLSFVQELVGNSNALVEQAARILTQVENQAFQIALLIEGIERVLNFLLRSLIETGDVHVSDAWADHEVQVDAVTWNFITHHSKFEGFLSAFANNRDVDSGAFWPLQQVGDIAGIHVVRGLAVYRSDDVPGMNARAICRASCERRDNNYLIVARPHRHTYAVVLSPL